MSDRKDEIEQPLNPYELNAQAGQNRAGVELQGGESFEEYESGLAIDPRAADDRLEDEGPEIRARKHARGHDVVDPDEPGEGDAEVTPKPGGFHW
jgi:hypothetical protein